MTSHKPQATSHKPQKSSRNRIPGQHFRPAPWAAGLLGISLSLASGTAALADSPKIYFATTGSYYQGITSSVSWGKAKTACEQKGAHLVTIGSKVENDFVSGKFSAAGNFWIGASDIAFPGVWQWVDNSPWKYESWEAGSPGGFPPGSGVVMNSSGMWYNYDANPQIYVCEWGGSYIQDIAEIGDVDGDRVKDIAVLKAESGYRVISFSNPKTGKQAGKIRLGKLNNITPAYIAGVGDMNKNGKPDFALFSISSTGAQQVQIRDSAAGALLKTFAVGQAGTEVQSMKAIADRTGDGVGELAIVTQNSTNLQKQLLIYNPATGAKIASLTP